MTHLMSTRMCDTCEYSLSVSLSYVVCLKPMSH